MRNLKTASYSRDSYYHLLLNRKNNRNFDIASSNQMSAFDLKAEPQPIFFFF